MTRTALSDNGKLANQIARLQAIVVKSDLVDGERGREVKYRFILRSARAHPVQVTKSSITLEKSQCRLKGN